MTTIKLSGGDLGTETMMVRCNLAEASAPIMVDYEMGHGWEHTQYQCADVSHRVDKLIALTKEIAAVAIEIPASKFQCKAKEV